MPGALSQVYIVRDKSNRLTGVDFVNKVETLIREAAYRANADTSVPWDEDEDPSVSATIALSNSVPHVVVQHSWHGQSLSSHTRDISFASFISNLCDVVQQDRTCVGLSLVVKVYDCKDFLKSKNLQVALGSDALNLPTDPTFVQDIAEFIATFCAGCQAACGSMQPLSFLVRTCVRMCSCVCVCVFVP
jgi:hypothetical protein